jgi:phospholipid/cholesterol/gamma-HCH transport system substrate-binding protein
MLTQGHGPALPDGAVLPLARTAEPVELDDVLGTLTPPVRAEMRGVIAQLDGSTRGLGNAFTATLKHSTGALRQTAALLGQVDSDGYALRTLITQGHAAAAAFAAQRPALGAAVDNVSGLLRVTAGREAALKTAVSELPAGLEQPRLALNRLHSAIPTLNGLVEALGPAAVQLRPTSTLLARTVTVGQPALASLDVTLRTAPAQLRALDMLLSVATPAARALTPTLTRVLPILDVVRVYTPELVGFLSGWSDMGSSFDVAGHGLRFATAILPPNRTVSANSNTPGYIPPPFLRAPGTLVGQPWTNYATSFLSKTPPGR